MKMCIKDFEKKPSFFTNAEKVPVDLINKVKKNRVVS